MTRADRRWAAVVAACAVLAGALLLLPDALIVVNRRFYQRRFPEAVAKWTMNGRYTAIAAFDDPDQNVYASRARSAADDLFADSYVKENRSPRMATLDTVTFGLLGAIQRATGDMTRTWLLARALGGAGWFLGLYWLVAALGKNRRFALLSAFFLVLFMDVSYDLIRPVMLAQGPRGLLGGARDALIHLVWPFGAYEYNFGVGRIINPCLSLPFLFLALALTARAAERGWRWAAGAALAGALLPYVHPDVWAIFLASSAGFAILRSLDRGRIQWPLFAIFVAACVASIPWLVYNYPPPADILIRESGVLGRSFNIEGLPYLLIFGAAWFKLRRDPFALLLACAVGAVGAVFEVQLVTGFNVTPGRWHYNGVVFAYVLGAGLLARRANDSRDWLWAAAFVCALFVGRVTSYAAQRFPYQGLPRDIDQALRFLDEKTPARSAVAVLAPQEAMLIPIYTRQKIVAPSGFLLGCDLPTREIFKRLNLVLGIMDIRKEGLIRRLQAPEVFAPELPEWNRKLWLGEADWRLREWDNFFYFYAQVMPRREFLDLLASLDEKPEGADVDYVMVTPFERELMNKGAEKALGEPAYRNATVSIYPWPPAAPKRPSAPAAKARRRARR